MLRPTPPPTVQRLVTDSLLPGLTSAIYTHLSTQLSPTPPPRPPTTSLSPSPSLLSHFTTVPLCSYNRHFKHNHLDNDTFTLLYKRNLRLPVLPQSLSGTPCRFCTPLDPYGDHLFQCRFSKKILSDNIRDALYTVCTHLAPMADFVHSTHSVTCEPLGLVPEFPTKRPANVALHIKQTARPPPAPNPILSTSSHRCHRHPEPCHRSQPARLSNRPSHQGPFGLAAH